MRKEGGGFPLKYKPDRLLYYWDEEEDMFSHRQNENEREESAKSIKLNVRDIQNRKMCYSTR